MLCERKFPENREIFIKVKMYRLIQFGEIYIFYSIIISFYPEDNLMSA